MRWMTWAMACVILTAGLAPASAQPAADASGRLQGIWTATRAQHDGKPADDVVGHRLSISGSRFRIESKDGVLLYAGRVRVDPSAKPAAIDFEHTEGTLKGKTTWKGIYALEGDTLTICDNAPNLAKGRPAAFEAKGGSGYILITFTRRRPTSIRSPSGTTAKSAGPLKSFASASIPPFRAPPSERSRVPVGDEQGLAVLLRRLQLGPELAHVEELGVRVVHDRLGESDTPGP